MVVDVVVAVVVVDVTGFSFGGIVSKCTVVVVKLDEETVVVLDIVVVVKLDEEIVVVLDIVVVVLLDVVLVVEIFSSSASSNPESVPESVSPPNPESAPPALAAAPLSPVPIPIVVMEADVDDISAWLLSTSFNIIGVVTEAMPISPIKAPKVIPIALFLLYLLLTPLPRQLNQNQSLLIRCINIDLLKAKYK